MDHRGQAQNRQVDHDPSTPFQRLSRAALDLVVPEAGIEREKRINAHKLKSAFLGMGNLGGRNRRARAGHDSDPVNGQQRRKSLHLWQETLPPPVRNQGIFNTLRTGDKRIGRAAFPHQFSGALERFVFDTESTYSCADPMARKFATPNPAIATTAPLPPINTVRLFIHFAFTVDNFRRPDCIS